MVMSVRERKHRRGSDDSRDERGNHKNAFHRPTLSNVSELPILPGTAWFPGEEIPTARSITSQRHEKDWSGRASDVGRRSRSMRSPASLAIAADRNNAWLPEIAGSPSPKVVGNWRVNPRRPTG